MKMLLAVLLLLFPLPLAAGEPIQLALTTGVQAVVGSVAAAAASFSPSDLSNIAVWYEAESALCSGACSDTSVLSTWEDKSTNNNDLTPCAGNSITYRTNQINSKAAIRFVSASNHCMTLGSSIAFGTGTTIFVVAKINTVDPKGAFVSSRAATGSVTYWYNTDNQQGADKGGVEELGNGTADSNTSWHQMNMTYDGTHIYFRLDRAADGDTAKSSTISNPLATVGSDYYGAWADADIAAIIIYTRVLNGTEIGQVETYLNGLYGL